MFIANNPSLQNAKLEGFVCLSRKNKASRLQSNITHLTECLEYDNRIFLADLLQWDLTMDHVLGIEKFSEFTEFMLN